MTIKDALNKGIMKLKEKSIEDPIIKSRILMSHILKKDKGYLITHDKEVVSKENVKVFLDNITLLIEGTPIQYVIKKQEFMKLNFYIDSHVLIPRCDTEILVEEVLSISKKYKKNVYILDLCTGSGVIAVTLAKNIEKCVIVRNRYK